MQVLSVNVGQPREVQFNGDSVLTSIFKEPVSGRVPVQGNNLAGDMQSDLRVHGGEHKALYAYPAEHYIYWRAELPGVDIPYKMFGENLTVEGLLEDSVYCGDVLRIGSAVLRVTTPRLPCFKLGIRFGRKDIVKRFWASERSGFYCAVVKEGEIGAGDSIEFVARDPHKVSIKELMTLYSTRREDLALLRRAVVIPGLPPGWREDFQETIAKLSDPA